MSTVDKVEEARGLLHAWRPSGRLIGLGRALVELDGELDWPYYLEKPHKWAREYVAWAEHDCPTDNSDDTWDAFAETVEEARR